LIGDVKHLCCRVQEEFSCNNVVDLQNDVCHKADQMRESVVLFHKFYFIKLQVNNIVLLYDATESHL